MRYITTQWKMLLLLLALSCISCSEEQEPYPDLITKFANVSTDSKGTMVKMTTDNGKNYTITNTNIKPHRANSTYRTVVAFVPNETHTTAHIYNLTGAHILADSTSNLKQDPTGIESMWHEGHFINMQLTAKTQGGAHHWGYAIDYVQRAGENGWKKAHHHLSLHHNQGADPISYSQTYYCSIHIPSIPNYSTTDTISVSVHTFHGLKTWTFYQ